MLVADVVSRRLRLAAQLGTTTHKFLSTTDVRSNSKNIPDAELKHFLLLVLAALTFTTNMSAQRDTTLPQIYGKLLAVSPTQITVEEYENDSAVRTREISIVQQTLIDGCTLDSVQLGVNTLVVLSPLKIYPPQAEIVKFDGCVSHIDAMANITAIFNDAIEVTTTAPSVFGQTGTNVSFQVFPETQYISCDGVLLVKNDLLVGDPVYVRSNGTLDNPRAIAIQALNDCSQVASAECTFVSAVDSSMHLLVDNTNDTLTLTLRFDPLMWGVPGDSALPLYNCDGRLLTLDDLRPGMAMQVTYLISPRKGLFLTYALVKENCPVAVVGTITAINGNRLTIASYGQSFDVSVITTTDLQNCQREVITFNDLAVGQTVDGYAIENAGQYDASRLIVLDDCAFAFTASGVVLSAESNSVTIDALDPVTGIMGGTEFTVDDATQFVDCSGLPIRQDAIQIGNTATIYYRISKGARFADMVFVIDPCISNYISGTITSIENDTLSVLLDKGELRSYRTDSASTLVNCRGELITLSPAAIGQRIEGLTSNANDGGLIINATIYTDCLQTALVSGSITFNNDSVITVSTPEGSRDVLRAPYSIISDDSGMMLDWSELVVGRTVCFVVDVSTQMVLRGLVDATCNDHWKPSNDPTMVTGRLRTVENNQLVVSTAAGEMMFAITPATQMMDERRNTLAAKNMTLGSTVRVTSKNHTIERQPIASTVVLLSTTSIDEDVRSESDLAVYPNPAIDVVQFNSAFPFESITITNMLGSIVAELRGTSTLDVSALACGTYVVTAQHGTQRSVKMMVKR